MKTVKRTAFKCQRDIYIIPTKWTDLFCDSKGNCKFLIINGMNKQNLFEQKDKFMSIHKVLVQIQFEPPYFSQCSKLQFQPIADMVSLTLL